MAPDSYDASPIPALATGGMLEHLYGGAVLHLAWIVSQGTRRLVFGYLECLPCEIPRPVDDGEYTTRLPGRTHRLYVRHLPLDIRTALAWYEAAIRGLVVRPDEDGSLPDAGGRGMLATAPLHEDVVWPRTLCVQRNAVPFLSLWHRTPRVHHLLPIEPWLVGDLDDRERSAVTDFVNEHFGFSLEEWTAFWGSIHIVLPDPYHREVIDTFEVDAAGEVLVVRVEPRQGLCEERPPMTLTVMEQRQSGVAAIVTRSLPSEGDVRIRLSPRLAANAISVADDEGTVYVARPPTHFLQSVDIAGHIQHTRRQVSLARRGKAPPIEYEVSVASAMIRSRVGDASPDTPRAETVLAQMSDRRKVSRMGRRLEQRWFYRERVAAEEHIRALIGHASERHVFVDS